MKEEEIYIPGFDTAVCVRCGKEIKWGWTGHVRDGDEIIGAGFCSEECCDKTRSNRYGYMGEWKSWMGKHRFLPEKKLLEAVKGRSMKRGRK